MKHSETLAVSNKQSAKPNARPTTKPQVLRVRIGGSVAVISVHVLPPKSRAQALPPDSVAAFVRAWAGGKTSYPRCPCASMDLYAAYLRWCRANGKTEPVAAHIFLQHVAALNGWSNRPRHVYAACGATKTRTRRVIVPAAVVLARRWRKGARSSTRWLTDAIAAFRGALDGAA